eukprot:gene14979-16679_t
MNFKVIPLAKDEETQLRYHYVPTVSAIEISETQPYEGSPVVYPPTVDLLQDFNHPNGKHPQTIPINTNVETLPLTQGNSANPGYSQEPLTALSYLKLQFMGLTRATQCCIGFLACCCCSIGIAAAIIAALLAPGIVQQGPYLVTGYYTTSDCSGPAIYELATRTDTCFTLDSNNSLQFIHSSQNTSIFTYQDRVCSKQTPNTTPQTISYETCQAANNVPGLYRKSFYSSNDYVYLFRSPYVMNDGYVDNDCSSSIEKMFITMYNCIPTSSNSAIQIIANSGAFYLTTYSCHACNNCPNHTTTPIKQGCSDTYSSYIPKLNEPYSLARYRMLPIGSST